MKIKFLVDWESYKKGDVTEDVTSNFAINDLLPRRIACLVLEDPVEKEAEAPVKKVVTEAPAKKSVSNKKDDDDGD